MSTSAKQQKFKFVRRVGTSETSNDDVRVARYPVPVEFAVVQRRVAELYNLDTKDFVLKYLDSENELIVLADDDDIQEAVMDHGFFAVNKNMPPQVASIRVHVLKNGPASPVPPPSPPSADNIPPRPSNGHPFHAHRRCDHGRPGAPPPPPPPHGNHGNTHRRCGSGGRGHGRGRRWGWGWGITQLEKHCQQHQRLLQRQEQKQQGDNGPRFWRQGGLHSVVKPLMGQLRTILSECEDNINMVIKVAVHPSCENDTTTASSRFEVPVPKEIVNHLKNKKTSSFCNPPSHHGSVRGALMEEIRNGRRVSTRLCLLQEIRRGRMLKKTTPPPPPLSTVPEQARHVARDAAKEALARKQIEKKEQRMQARAQERQEKQRARAQERQEKQQAQEERRQAHNQTTLNQAMAAALLKQKGAGKDKDIFASAGLVLFDEQISQVSVAADSSDDGFVKVVANDESNGPPPLAAAPPHEVQTKDTTASTIMEAKVELLKQMGLDLGEEGTERLIEAMGGHIDLIITALVKNKKH